MASTQPGPRYPGLRAAPRTWDRESIVTALRTWAAEQGRPPRSYEWAPASGRAGGLVGPEPVRYELEHPRWPSTVMVAKHFGSWSDALRAAGLPARIPERDLPRAARVEAAQRLQAAGQTIRAIADLIGVADDIARAYARATICADCGGPVICGTPRCQGCSNRARNQRACTREEATAAIQAWASETGTPPMASDWQPSSTTAASKWRAEYPRFPTAATVKRLFGNWERALRAAGYEPRLRQWTREMIIDALRKDVAARGRPPRYREWQRKSDDHPDASTTAAHFGTWKKALVAAGLHE